MELTPGIIKSLESAIAVSMNRSPMYMLKYKGRIFIRDKTNVRLFAKPGAAKASVTLFIEEIFRHGEYWQSCRSQIKEQTGYEVDFSETIKMLPSKGLTSRFDDPKNKKMFKEISEELFRQEIFTIEEI